MKHLSITLLFIGIFISLSIKAQQNHFIYLQTLNKQPFYLKFQSQVYSSSFSGYLLIPKLKVGVYSFLIGFPKNEFPEQTIHCAVENKDYGYLLKPFENDRWGFFNLQTLNVLMADEVISTQSPVAEFKSDVFSNMLSTVVNDPSIKQIDPVVTKKIQSSAIKESPNEVVNKQVVTDKNIEIIDTGSIAKLNKEVQKNKLDDSTIDAAIVVAPMAVIDAKVMEPKAIAYKVTKKKINKNNQGIELVYLETVDGIKDTIKIFIPSGKINKENNLINNVTLKEQINKEALSIEHPSADKKDNKFLSLDLPSPVLGPLPAKTDSVLEKSPTPVINSDCKNLASNEDFLKLRKKMAGENHGDNMIAAAKKTFRLKCFTTEQIKNLSVLFLKDMDKYNFFDTAYPFVQDAQNYQTLQDQLSDNYYIDRFKVMIRH